MQLVTEQVVLVDFENVQGVDLARISTQARIKVFVGQSQSKLPTALVQQAQALGSRLE